MIWHVFSAIRGIVVGIFMTEYRKRRYSSKSRSSLKSSTASRSSHRPGSGRDSLFTTTNRPHPHDGGDR